MNKKIFKNLILKAKKFKKARHAILSILFTVLTLILIYNSCSPQGFYTVNSSKVSNNPTLNRDPSQQNNGPQDGNPFQNISVEIKNGADSTSTLQNIPLQLAFTVSEQNSNFQTTNYEMQISQTPDCASGTWETYTENTTRPFTSSKEEEMLSIYVKLRKKGTQEESRCVSDSIFYDNLAPRNLRLSGIPPPETTNQRAATFRFTAEDDNPMPLQFECQLKKPDNSLIRWAPCSSGKTYESSALSRDGQYTFSLRAKDSAENTSETFTHPWTIDRTAPTLSISNCPSGTIAGNHQQISVQLSDHSTFDFPVNLFCQNSSSGQTGTQYRICRIIQDSNNPTATISSSHIMTENLDATGNYRKRTLVMFAKDSALNHSSQTRCSWYEDTDRPSFQFVDPLPEFSFGPTFNNTGLNSGRHHFKIRIDDSSLQSNNFQSGDIRTEYNVYYNTTRLNTCNNPTHGWCSISSPRPEIRSNNGTHLEQKIYIENLMPGIESPNEHTIHVRVKDAAGNASAIWNHTWDVYGEIEEKTTIYPISSASQRKVDILFVIDDSRNMQNESEALGSSIISLIDKLNSENLDWQMAITSMEKSNRGATKRENFGKLVQLIKYTNENNRFLELNSNKKYILSYAEQDCPTTPSLYCSSSTSNLEGIFKKTIEDRKSGQDYNFDFYGHHEYGIQSVNVLLDYYRHRSTNDRLSPTDFPPPNDAEYDAIRSFFREGATFVVILITDEKNCGCETTLEFCTFTSTLSSYNDPISLFDKVKRFLGKDKKFIFYPMIPRIGKGLNAENCRASRWRGRYPWQNIDDDYWVLAETTQGETVFWVDLDTTSNRTSRTNIEGDDCTSTNGQVYGKDLCIIGEDISRKTTNIIQLECAPIENPPSVDDYQTQYFYTSNQSASASDSSFRSITRNGDTLTVPTTASNTVEVTISESFTPYLNQLTLQATDSNDIPQGTYKVKYFCHK